MIHKYLAYLKTIETGSITQAAAELGYTQSAVSRMIADLEEEVPYEFELTRSVIPLGIAGDLYVDDDETGISNDYRERYLAWKASRVRARFCPAEV